MSSKRQHLLVAGGSGWVGRHVCRFAVSLGHRVTSLSSEGRPGTGEPWEEGVDWHEGTLQSPDTWPSSLALESVDVAIATLGRCPDDPDSEDTFASLHRDGVITLGRTLRSAGISTFVLLSTSGELSELDERYLEAEREAESWVLDAGFDRYVVLHSPPAYEEGRPTSIETIPFRRDARGDREALDPLPVEQIAIATLRAALEPDRSGVFEAHEVADLGEAVMIQ